VDNWVRLDLGARYDVSKLMYQGHSNSTTIIRNYKVYVTDVDSTVQSDWGEPVVQGTFAGSGNPQLVSLTPTIGRYVILYGADCYYQWGGAELAAFGYPAAALTEMTQFAATPHIGVGPFAVSMAANAGDGATIEGYRVTTSSVPPLVDGPGWSTEVTEFVVPPGTPKGPLTLYGWAKDNVGTVVGKITAVVYWTTPEIPKAPPMTATGDNIYSAFPSLAIDKNLNTAWEAWYAGVVSPTGCARIDLGERYVVDLLSVLPNDRGSRTKGYEVYVTDSSSTAKEDWGAPVVSGEFPDSDAQQDVVIPPTAGRYVILNGLSSHITFIGAKELWVYGTLVPETPAISQFTLADQSTGSTLFTNSAIVDVTITVDPSGPEAAAFLITTTDDAPDPEAEGWGPRLPPPRWPLTVT